MTNLEILKAARALISRPSGWTQMAWARNLEGGSTPPEGSAGVCFCAAGALRCVAGGRWASAVEEFNQELFSFSSIVQFNDHPDRTQEEVVSLFDRTIKRLELQG